MSAGVTRTFTIRGEGPEVTVYFNPPIHLGQTPHGLGLVSFESYNRILTVHEGANAFYYDKHVLRIPNGTYSVEDIAEHIERVLIAQFGIEDFVKRTRWFRLTANNATHKCIIDSSFKIDFESQSNSIGPLLGFSPKILAARVRHESDHPIRLLEDHHVTITCNIITDVYTNQEASHTLHEFIITDGANYIIREVPRTVLYHPIAVRNIHDITLRLVNRQNQLIKLDPKTHVSYTLHMKPE